MIFGALAPQNTEVNMSVPVLPAHKALKEAAPCGMLLNRSLKRVTGSGLTVAMPGAGEGSDSVAPRYGLPQPSRGKKKNQARRLNVFNYGLTIPAAPGRFKFTFEISTGTSAEMEI